MMRAFTNCAPCADFGCDRLAGRLVVSEDIVRRMGAAIPDADRAKSIALYENKSRSAGLRSRRS